MPSGFNCQSQGLNGGAARPIIGEQSLDYYLLFGAATHETRSASAFMVSYQIVRGVGQHFAGLVIGLPYIGLTWRHHNLRG